MARVILKIPQIIKLHSFYTGLGDEALKITRKEVAERAKAYLGFDVTEHNIRTLEEGLKIRRKIIYGQGSDDIVVIVARMIEFMEAMDYDAPDDLWDLLRLRQV